MEEPEDHLPKPHRDHHLPLVLAWTFLGVPPRIQDPLADGQLWPSGKPIFGDRASGRSLSPYPPQQRLQVRVVGLELPQFLVGKADPYQGEVSARSGICLLSLDKGP